MYRTDNPARDYDRYAARMQQALDCLPRCFECGEAIQTDEYYELDDGKYLCPACLDENHKRWTEDFIG